MKIGDLVLPKSRCACCRPNEGSAIIIEKGVYAGNKDLKLLWDNGTVSTESSQFLDAVDEAR